MSEQLSFDFLGDEEDPLTLADILYDNMRTYSFEQFRIALEAAERAAKSDPRLVVNFATLKFMDVVPDHVLVNYELMSSIAHGLGLDRDIVAADSSDIDVYSEDTIIVFGSIPKKYISVYSRNSDG